MSARVTHNKSYANYLKKGDNNVISDRSGFKVKASECKYEWNGLYVHKDEWEERQPLDLIRGIPDDQSVEISRPPQTDVFLTANEVTPDDL